MDKLDIEIVDVAAKKNTVKINPKEFEVVKYLAQGMTNPEISKCMGVSPRTVQAHIFNLMKKLKVKNRMQIVLKLVQNDKLDLKTIKQV